MTARWERQLHRLREAPVPLERVRERAQQPPRPGSPHSPTRERVMAGVVGIAVFVAAIWIVTRVGPLDRSETSVAPGGDATGSAVTPTMAPNAGWDGLGIPPEGVALSTPVEGEVVASFAEFHVGFVFVYADGRVLWSPSSGGVHEQRLTPEGVELLLSELLSTGLFDRDRYDFQGEHGFGSWGQIEARNGDGLVRVAWSPSAPMNEVATLRQTRDLIRLTDRLSGFLRIPTTEPLPADAWADPEIRPYAPARYAICFWGSDNPPPNASWVDPSRVVDLLPAPAQTLLRGKERSYEGVGLIGDPEPAECFEVTTEQARALDGILSDAGVQRQTDGDWFVRDDGGARVGIQFKPLFPDGLWHALGG